MLFNVCIRSVVSSSALSIDGKVLFCEVHDGSQEHPVAIKNLKCY